MIDNDETADCTYNVSNVPPQRPVPPQSSSSLPDEVTPLFRQRQSSTGSNNSSSIYYYGRQSSSGREDSSVTASIRHGLRSTLQTAVEGSFRLSGSQCSMRDFAGQATIRSEIINMTKNLVGAGVLSLSGGLALYSDQGGIALGWGIFWIVLLGVIFAYFCILIGKVCQLTYSATFREAWHESVGEHGGIMVALVNAIKPALGNLAYSIILSQTMQSLLEGIDVYWMRTTCLVLVTVFAILPLCLLKNLNVLAPFSVLGTLGVVGTAVCMLMRYMDGSYQPDGRFYQDILPKFQPSFDVHGTSSYVRLLPFVTMTFEAFVMHYNAPRFYTELHHASVSRFTKATAGAFAIAAVIYIAIASFGFLTFGGHANSYILNNYSPRDLLATACRIAVAISTLATYPLSFIGFRDGVLDILDVPLSKQTSGNLNMLTVVLLAMLTFLAAMLDDLGQINAIGGGTMATILVFVLPTVMFRAATTNDVFLYRNERILSMALMVLGVLLGTVGTWQAAVK